MPILRPRVVLALGAFAVVMLAVLGGALNGPRLAAKLDRRAAAAIVRVGGAPVTAHFVSANGWPTRHPVLGGGEGLADATRDRVAKAVAAIPGVGGVSWADGEARVAASALAEHPLHCQDDVQALLRARTIRFEEGSARIRIESRPLIDEVAHALEPCLGSIISITGHTDASGPEPGNIALSQARAEAVQAELNGRGIPSDGLRVRGLGSREPVEGLAAEDPANRRIEFAVIASEPIAPTPVDTPGPR